MGMHNLAMLMGGNALVLREKEINEYGPVYVRLVGRKPGLLDWLLTIIGINTTVVFEVYDNRVEYSYGSLSGRMTETIPLSKISNLMCGYFKPFFLLVLAAILFIAGICVSFSAGNGILFIFGLIFSIVCVICYFLKKTTMVSVIPNSACPTTVVFKRSLIENNNISAEEAQQIISIINALVAKANS